MRPTYSTTTAFVHRQPWEGVKTELDLFTVPPTQTCIVDSHVVEHHSHGLSGLGWTGRIPDTWIGRRLPRYHQHDTTRAGEVIRANGDDLDLVDPEGPVNNWLHSLFSQVDVYLNGTLVTPSTNTNAHRAYIETLLSYGTDAKVTQLTSQLWHKDKATHMDAVAIVDGPAAKE